MDFLDLETKLSKNISPVYIISGEDFFIMQQSLNLVKQVCTPNFADLNCVTFDGENYVSASNIVSSCQVLPLNDLKRLIIVKDIKLTANDLKEFENYFKNPNVDCCLVFYLTDKSDIYNLALKFGELIDCHKPTLNYVIKTFANTLTEQKVKIDDNTMRHLCGMCGFDLMRIGLELEKLIPLAEGGAISIKLIDDIVEKDLEFKVYELADALVKKNANLTYQILNKFLKNKSEAEYLIPTLYGQFNRMLFASLNSDTKLLESAFKVKEFAITKAREHAKNYSQIKLKNIVSKILEYEANVKMGVMLLDNALFNLTTYILTI